METVYKYPFEIADIVTVEMPRHAQILSIQCQNNVPTIWARVDIENGLEQRRFHIFGTGQEMSHNDWQTGWHYLATIQQDVFVWHIFEAVW